jgi:hypothetical protein
MEINVAPDGSVLRIRFWGKGSFRELSDLIADRLRISELSRAQRRERLVGESLNTAPAARQSDSFVA